MVVGRTAARLAALALLVGSVGVMSPAAAQERYTDPQGRFLDTSHTELGATGCSVTITLRNNSGWIYPTSVEIDGVHSYGPTVDNRTDTDGNGTLDLNGPIQDRSVTRTLTYTDGVERTIRYRVQAGSENNLYLGHDVGEWTTFTFPALTLRERVERGCIAQAVEPQANSTDEQETFIDCDSESRITRTERTTTTSVYDPDTNTWSPGPPVITYHDVVAEPATADELEAAACPATGAGGGTNTGGGTSGQLPDVGAPSPWAAPAGLLMLVAGMLMVALGRLVPANASGPRHRAG